MSLLEKATCAGLLQPQADIDELAGRRPLDPQDLAQGRMTLEKDRL